MKKAKVFSVPVVPAEEVAEVVKRAKALGGAIAEAGCRVKSIKNSPAVDGAIKDLVEAFVEAKNSRYVN